MKQPASAKENPKKKKADVPRLPMGAQPLARILPEILSQTLQKRGFANVVILREWPSIVGAMLAEWSAPLQIRWPKHQPEASLAAESSPIKDEKTLSSQKRYGKKAEKTEKAVLVLRVASAFALEVQMREAQLIEAVNRRLGFACIGRLEIQQAPPPERKKLKTPPPPLDQILVKQFASQLKQIEDPDLRQSLARLGARIHLAHKREKI